VSKLVVTTFVTLDGIYQAPGGPEEDRSGGFEQGASALNRLPKYVASRSLEKADWQHSTVIRDVPSEVAALKEQLGGELQVHGSGSLIQTLILESESRRTAPSASTPE
jgi:dihydrofolate reductase